MDETLYGFLRLNFTIVGQYEFPNQGSDPSSFPIRRSMLNVRCSMFVF
jgi:hypothetical protein